MTRLLLELALAPALAAAATLAGRRWSERVGGVVSAFPAIVGPLLIITAHDHGAAFASRTAVGTLLGLIGLSGFVVAYVRVGERHGWAAGLAAGWAAAAALGLALGRSEATLSVATAGALVSILVAQRLLPPSAPNPRELGLPRVGVPGRMALTAGLVVVLALAADRFGALVGGILAALPVLASILAVTAHRRQGAPALRQLLHGMLRGMLSFVAFCALVAALIEPLGAVAAFAIATTGALAVTAASLSPPRRVQTQT